MARPIHLSSNWTLFLKILLPILWGVFFGLLTVAFWVSSLPSIGGLSIWAFRALMTSFFLTGMGVLYFSLIQLKRIEADSEFLYVTNYRRTARYPYHNVEKIEEVNYFLFKVGRVIFQEPGLFGRKVIFLANSYRLEEAFKRFTALAQRRITA